MVDFTLTDEQKDLRELAHNFAEKEIRTVAWDYDRDATCPKEVIEKAHEVGLMNVEVPEEYGGGGLHTLDGCLIEEEFGWGCSGIGTSLMCNGLASAPVILGGSEEVKKSFLGMLCEEPKLASFCLTEPEAGSDVGSMRTRAVKQGRQVRHQRLQGLHHQRLDASWYTVYAKTDPEAGHKGISAFVVPRDLPGVSVVKKEDKLGQRASDTAQIQFDDVEIPAEYLLGEENHGFRLAMMTLDRTRPGVAAMAVGIARAAFEFATRILEGAGPVRRADRDAPGDPVHDRRHGDQGRGRRACSCGSRRRCSTRASATRLPPSHAKRFAADSAMEIATDAVQVYGGYGFIKEYPVEKLMRDAKIMQLYEGTSQIQRLVIAREVLMPRRVDTPAMAAAATSRGVTQPVAAGARPGRVVAVLGMHRSGTSALRIAGAARPVPRSREHEQRAQPEGQPREHRGRRLNEDVLRSSGGAWKAPPPDVRWSDDHDERARRLLADHAGQAVWGFKDPRTLLTLDGWHTLVPDLERVGIFRHPLRVARSLEQRDGMEREAAVALWRAYNAAARGAPRRPSRAVLDDEPWRSREAARSRRSRASLDSAGDRSSSPPATCAARRPPTPRPLRQALYDELARCRSA